MALPSQSNQLGLEYTVYGMPYVNVTGTTAVNADGIHYITFGMPYYATLPYGITYNAFQFFMLF